MTPFTDNELLRFIHEAHGKTYAAPEEVKSRYRCDRPQNAGHREYEYINGLWRYRDSYAGWRQAPGEEKVYFDNQCIWRMSYQGRVESSKTEAQIEEIYQILQQALLRCTVNEPYRGIRYLKSGSFEYHFDYEGDLEYLCGREFILEDGRQVYFQDIHACKVIF